MGDGLNIIIPTPPSVNAMYCNSRNGKGRGRYKSRQYKEWLDEAGWSVKAQRPERVAGPYWLAISLPRIRGDIDNRVKAINDLLVSLNLVDDDKHCEALTIKRRSDLGLTEITVTAAGGK